MIDLGRLFIIGVTFLISFLAYTSQIFIFWDHLGGLNVDCLKVLIPFNVCVIMIFWNYYLTCTTDPGRVPKGWYPEENQENVELKRTTRAPRYCKTCAAFKPPRTHHCRTCKRCVLKMDHHCPWTNNCVGHYNYGHFIRFVFWVDVTCTFHFILMIRRTAKIIQDMSYYRVDSEPTTTETIFLILNYIAVIPVLFSVGILSLYHFYCMLSNTTTIESWEKDKVSTMVRRGKIKEIVFPYDIGIYKNIKSILGNNPLLWCLPRKMHGTGLSYPVTKDADPTIWPPKDPTLPLSNSAKPWNNNKDGDDIFVTDSLLDNEIKKRRRNTRKSTSSDIIIQQNGGEFKYSQRKIRRDSEGYIVKDITLEEKGYYYGEEGVEDDFDSEGSVTYPSSDEYSDDISESEYVREYENDNEVVENVDDHSESIGSKRYKELYQNPYEDDDNLPIGLMISKKQLEAMNVTSDFQAHNHSNEDDDKVMAYTINDNNEMNDMEKS
ncbi:5190_t:CDS:2 [Funneliformis caledonium]|uniref:Palmitoyltransferase PFA4 n=1 Tax=Funneliformis caledonium TaxID=1117310 RepID=A0A9N9CRP7_9GLOM|nr:5190_t:CDS:2 [Funneliformis caledonium]